MKADSKKRLGVDWDELGKLTDGVPESEEEHENRVDLDGDHAEGDREILGSAGNMPPPRFHMKVGKAQPDAEPQQHAQKSKDPPNPKHRHHGASSQPASRQAPGSIKIIIPPQTSNTNWQPIMQTNDIFCNLVDYLLMLRLGETKEEALVHFSKLTMPSTPRTIVEKARPGYYGPKGYAVICASILQFINPTTTPNDAFSPLTLEQFTHFILIPNIACHLIAKDLEITPMEAYEEMMASGEVGKYLQELDDTGGDDVLDGITMRAVTGQKQKEQEEPGRPRKLKMLQHLPEISHGPNQSQS
ncbi:hypothetical protein PAXRUDRAFT_16630 [Paxillus rubicundulus Ve08.2h10]|uniref:Restriction of telomere capping protein 4 C-terminal domain-containing protein n=1 Tax=Paxillus rubicundulus Ve08.2h10 TaxID=930991 RepID=A0A0D0C7E0_9AGAM|nr:hypothetical protein PAXRUDRAFT_16630 [Paxillus rubicundulus Ve08.2h10]